MSFNNLSAKTVVPWVTNDDRNICIHRYLNGEMTCVFEQKTLTDGSVNVSLSAKFVRSSDQKAYVASYDHEMIASKWGINFKLWRARDWFSNPHIVLPLEHNCMIILDHMYSITPHYIVIVLDAESDSRSERACVMMRAAGEIEAMKRAHVAEVETLRAQILELTESRATKKSKSTPVQKLCDTASK